MEDFAGCGALKPPPHRSQQPVRLRAITSRAVRALEEAGFLVSAKSTLEPVTEIFFLGKYVNLDVRTIRSHPQAFLQMFNIWLRLATRSRPSSRLRGPPSRSETPGSGSHPGSKKADNCLGSGASLYGPGLSGKTVGSVSTRKAFGT